MKDPKKFKKKAKSEKGLFFQKNELDSSLDNASFIKNWNKEGGKKDDKAAPTKQYKHFEK